MAGQKIRIKLAAYDHELVDLAAQRIVEAACFLRVRRDAARLERIARHAHLLSGRNNDLKHASSSARLQDA